MDNTELKKKNPPVIKSTTTIPHDPRALDRAIAKQRKMLASMVEEPQRCRLLKKMRQNWDVQQDLNAMRIATRERLWQCRTKRDVFDQQRNELRDAVQEHEHFIRDTDIKIERAEKKAKDEQNACNRLDDEIAGVQHEILELRRVKEDEIHNIIKHMHYRQFLSNTAHIYGAEKNSLWPKEDDKYLEDGSPGGSMPAGRQTVDDGTTFITQ